MKKQRILFATMPMDGHFSPLTSLAVYLSGQGHDVRWYVGGHYGEKVAQLGLYHYPFIKARTVNQENLESLFPERARIRSSIARLRFDINEVFLNRTPEFVEDLKNIFDTWPYDLVIHDMAFLGGIFIRELLPVKTVSIGVVPLAESDPYLPPAGLGKQPSTSLPGRWMQHLSRYVVQNILFKPCNDLHNTFRAHYGLPKSSEFVFDFAVHSPDLYLQSGVPGLEFARKQISANVRFVGAMLPYARRQSIPFKNTDQAQQAQRVVLVTQGTVERDVEKIIVPTLEAYKNDSSTLVVATTGGSQTRELRSRYPQEHFIIEDFIDFQAVMPYASVYVTNGGYGGVMLGLQHKLPLVVAGVHEGKNEIAARIAYSKVGIDLKTETPTPGQIRQAVEQVTTDTTYYLNLRKLSREFASYNTNELAATYIGELMEEDAYSPAKRNYGSRIGVNHPLPAV